MQRTEKYYAKPVIHLGEAPTNRAEWNIFQGPAGEVLPVEDVTWEDVTETTTPSPTIMGAIEIPRTQIKIHWVDLAQTAGSGLLAALNATGRLIVGLCRVTFWVVGFVGSVLIWMIPSGKPQPFDDCGQPAPKRVTEIEYLKIKITEL